MPRPIDAPWNLKPGYIGEESVFARSEIAEFIINPSPYLDETKVTTGSQLVEWGYNTTSKTAEYLPEEFNGDVLVRFKGSDSIYRLYPTITMTFYEIEPHELEDYGVEVGEHVWGGEVNA